MRRLLLVAAGYSMATSVVFELVGTLSWLSLLVTVVLGLALGAVVMAPPRQDPIVVVVEVADEDMMITQFVVPVLVPAGLDDDEKSMAAFMVQNALPLPSDTVSLATRWRDA